MCLLGLILAALVAFIAYDTIGSRERLRSLLGIVILYGIGYVFSADRSKVVLQYRKILSSLLTLCKCLQIKWRTVINGILFQLLLGIFCIRMEIGRKIFRCFGDKMNLFFGYALQGSAFVYGDLVDELHVFAFSVS